MVQATKQQGLTSYMSASPMIRWSASWGERVHILFIILSLRTLPGNRRYEINVSRVNEFNVILFFFSHGHPAFLRSNSYLHLTPERYVTIYSKDRLHPFPPIEAKGNLYFPQARERRRNMLSHPSPPPAPLQFWLNSLVDTKRFCCSIWESNTATNWAKNNPLNPISLILQTKSQRRYSAA